MQRIMTKGMKRAALFFLLPLLCVAGGLLVDRAAGALETDTARDAGAQNVAAMIALAEVHRNAGRFAEAQAVLEAALQKQALAPTDQQQLRTALAELHRVWGDALEKRYNHAEAISHYETAIGLDRETRPKEAAAAMTALGEVYYNTDRHAQAIATYKQALALQRQIGDRLGEARTLAYIGKTQVGLSQTQSALENLEQALAIQRDLHDRQGEGRTLASLGDAYEERDQYDKALDSRQQALVVLREVHDREGEAEVLSGIGDIRTQQSQLDVAMSQYEQALTIARELGDRRREGWILNGPSGIHALRGQYPKASDVSQQVLTIARAVQSPQLEWNALFSLGMIAMLQGQPDRQREYHEQALTIARALQLKKLEGYSLKSLGSLYNSLSQYDKATSYYEAALTLARERQDTSEEITLLGLLSNVYIAQGQYAKVISVLEPELVRAREIADPGIEALILSNLGTAYVSLGQYAKALTYYEPALVLRQKEGYRQQKATMLNNIGNAYRALGQYDKAAAYLEQALTIARDIHGRPLELLALNNLSTVFLSTGQFDKAISYLEPALVIAREVKDKMREGMILTNLGLVHHRTGHFAQALAFYGQALAIAREVNSRSYETTALNNLATIHHEVGQYAQEIPLLDQALAIAQETKARADEAGVLGNLGRAYDRLDQPEKAIPYAEQALEKFREIGDRRGEGVALGILGSIYTTIRLNQAPSTRIEHWEKGIVYYEQSLTLARELNDRHTEGITLQNLATAHFSVMHWDQARTFREQALPLIREAHDLAAEGTCLSGLMNLWHLQGKRRLAIFYGKQAVNVYQTMRKENVQLPKDMQQSFLAKKEGTYRTLADLLITEGRLPEAEQVLHLLKEEELFEFVRRDATAVDALARVALTNQEQEWATRYLQMADRLSSLGKTAQDLQTKKARTLAEDTQLEQLQTELHAAHAAFEQFLAELQTALGTTYVAEGALQAVESSRGLQQTLEKLGAGTVMLYTLVGETTLRVILVTPQLSRAYETAIAAADLNRKVHAFRDVLQDPTRDPRPLARELYSLILGPVATDLQTLGARTLMWSLDGTLRYLPIAALHDGQQYVLERYRTVLFTTRSEKYLRQPPRGRWRAAGLGVSKEHAGFTALAHVPEELFGIVQTPETKGVLPGMVALDERFTLAALTGALRERYPVLHLASHFSFQPGADQDSFLLLGDGQKLTIAELKVYRFPAVELLTLSACNTALGDRGNGREMESFAMLAQERGAQAVLATLWPVADASTKELMQTFYRTREAKKGTSKAEALRQAQLALLRGARKSNAPDKSRGVVQVSHDAPSASAQNNPAPSFVKDPAVPYAHPYYWAPFILIGNWR